MAVRRVSQPHETTTAEAWPVQPVAASAGLGQRRALQVQQTSCWCAWAVLVHEAATTTRRQGRKGAQLPAPKGHQPQRLLRPPELERRRRPTCPLPLHCLLAAAPKATERRGMQ